VSGTGEGRRADACLLAIGGGPGSPPDGPELAAAVQAAGLDPYLVRTFLNARTLTVLGEGSADQLAPLVQALGRLRTPAAVVEEAEVRSLDPPQRAGGVRSGPELLVHGRPAGPPAGEPILLVFGDLAAADAPPPAAAAPAAELKARVIRARCPVLDIAWSNGRLRVAAARMSWAGLPGHTLSAPLNLVRLAEALAQRSGGAVLDGDFSGQLLAGPPVRRCPDGIDGADRGVVLAFEQYSALAALAWQRGLYGPARASRGMTVAGPPPVPAREKGADIPWLPSPARPRAVPVRWAWAATAVVVAAALWMSAGRGAGGPPLAAAVAFGLAGGAGLFFGLRALREREEIRSIPYGTVRGLAMGPVELSGTVAACARLAAPFSKLPCAWYDFEFQELQTGPRGGQRWKTVERGGSGDIPFRLDDATGSVLVQPAGARVEMDSVTTPLSAGSQVVERVIPEGAVCFVTGVAQRRAVPDRLAPLIAARLERVRQDPARLARYGVVPGSDPTPAQWERARSEAEAEVIGELSDRASDPDDVYVGFAPGFPFLVSNRPRREETSRLTWKFAAGAVLGGVLLLAGLLLVFSRP
jgi:hypothetical protein